MQSLSFLNCNQVKCQSDIPDLSSFHVTELFLLKLFDFKPFIIRNPVQHCSTFPASATT